MSAVARQATTFNVVAETREKWQKISSINGDHCLADYIYQYTYTHILQIILSSETFKL